MVPLSNASSEGRSFSTDGGSPALRNFAANKGKNVGPSGLANDSIIDVREVTKPSAMRASCDV